MKSIKAIFRRGHKEGQAHPDNISRTSSITNLDSLEASIQQGKGAKPRKTASKERIDKQGQDGKKITKNNNKLEAPVAQPLSYSADSLQESELQQLRKQLQEMADEKSSLALQLGEQRGQLNVLQTEILKLKEESNIEMEKLAEENTALRNRLRNVAHSPLSDNEKQQLLFESRHHSSAPASIATNVVDENGGDTTACTTPDWDKHSSGNVSEVSVACLQDKINQMQETHYSTNEELQATLQELTDLQRQLTELQQENERLNEEKTLMFDSLCRQTERLNDSRQEVENLKQLLYRDRSDETNQFEGVVEREQKLVELLRSSQEEREQMLLKLEQVQAELHDSRSGNFDKTETINQLTERVKTLECTLDAKHAEHKQLDQELAQAKDQCSGKQIEIDRLSDLLDNARTKISELEQDRTLSDKSELDELLDNARKEKDQLESEISYLKEQLARSKNENEKLKEQVFVLQEECKVTRNNAKTTQSDLEYKCEKIVAEKAALAEQLQQFQEAVNELQVQAQCHIEDKRQLSAVLSETQRNMSEAERKNLNLENELLELRKLRADENAEWEKFQNDLLTSVRVANDFKTEAQQELQKFILENKTYREKVRLLEGQVEKLKGDQISVSTQTDVILTPQIVTLAKNLDPAIPNRLSLLEKPPEEVDGPKNNMEKLFPILKDRRSKSKENLADSSFHGSSRSRGSNSLERPKKGDKSDLKKSKSRDDLTQYAFDDKQDIPSKEKGSRSFLRWNKSKDNLDQVVADCETPPSPTKEKKSFFKRKKSSDDLEQTSGLNITPEREDKPRKRKESADTSSESNKSEPKPEFFSKFIKRRDKKPPNRLQSHPKFMSVEEELLLKSLDNWYDTIDQNVPEEFLTEEERAIKKLKILYEDDMLKEKPVAHKPKERLAISKPLLNSVVSNPKLEQIFRNPRLPTVDPEVRESALEENCSLADGKSNPAPYKSRSLEEINIFEEYRSESSMAPVLFRAVETDSSRKAEFSTVKSVQHGRRSSEIQPSDSVSNPRHSAKFPMENDLPKPNIYVNYENLDEIIANISSESHLTEEQKFALKLKRALDEAEETTSLKRDKKKKKQKSIKGLPISTPTRDSVEKNWKLKEIMLNPGIKPVQRPKSSNRRENEWKRHSTDVCSALGSPHSVLRQEGQSSKSYEDISFTFIPENTLLNLYFGDKIRESRFSSDRYTSSSSHSFTSAEFNLDTGNIKQGCEVPPQFQSEQEDLLYNETLEKNKESKGKVRAKEALAQLKKDLSSQEEEVHHPKIIDEMKNYETNLKDVLRRMEHDELRRSLRKQRLDNLEGPKEEKSLEEDVSQHELKIEKISYEYADVDESSSSWTMYTRCFSSGDAEGREITNVDAKIVESHSEDTKESLGLSIDPNDNNTEIVELRFEGPREIAHINNDEEEDVSITPDEDAFALQEQPGDISDVPEEDAEKRELPLPSPPFELPESVDDDITISAIDEVEAPYPNEPPQPLEYQQTLRENRYGVASPLSVRTTYRSVVNEYKEKYHPVTGEESSQENFECSDNSFEDFFKPVNDFGIQAPKFSEPVIEEIQILDECIESFDQELNSPDNDSAEDVEDVTTNEYTYEEVPLRRVNVISQIDQDMQDIMDKYLNTRASLLLKKIDEGGEGNSKLDITEVTAQPAIVIEDEDISANDMDEPLSLQDLQFIEEMKAKYSSGDAASDRSSDAMDSSPLPKEGVPRRPSKTKSSRPLSELNDNDLQLIEEVTKRQIFELDSEEEEQPPPLPASPVPTKTAEVLDAASDLEVPSHLPPSLRPKIAHGNVIFRQKPRPQSAAEESSTTKRLSDLIFKETIFVPLGPPSVEQENASENRISATNETLVNEPKYHQTNRETLFVSRRPQQRESHYLAGSAMKTAKVTSKNDVLVNMNEPQEILSEVVNISDDPTKLESVLHLDNQEPKEVANNVEEELILVDESRGLTDISRKYEEKASKVVEKVNQLNNISDSEFPSDPSSDAAIAIATKPEKLNIAQQPATVLSSDDVEEIPRRPSDIPESDVNLFQMDPQGSHDSYLDLFKSKESRDFDNLQGKKPKGFLDAGGFVYVEQIVLEDESDSTADEATPKVIDFVPLDDKTTPVFTKTLNYDTLEREQTFQVLEQAAKASATKIDEKPEERPKEDPKQVPNASVEILAKNSSSFSKGSSRTNSRTSFTQAKKIFEALEEANKVERPKTAFVPKTARPTSFRDSKSFEGTKGFRPASGKEEIKSGPPRETEKDKN